MVLGPAWDQQLWCGGPVSAPAEFVAAEVVLVEVVHCLAAVLVFAVAMAVVRRLAA